jgi:hypothetical protein
MPVRAGGEELWTLFTAAMWFSAAEIPACGISWAVDAVSVSVASQIGRRSISWACVLIRKSHTLFSRSFALFRVMRFSVSAGQRAFCSGFDSR